MAFRSRRSRFRTFGRPKFKNGARIGQWTVKEYLGHSDINKRDGHRMSKPQHWYGVTCSCGTGSRRSQQELIDKRREQMCALCKTNPQPSADKETV